MLELRPNGLEVGKRGLPLESKPTRADRSLRIPAVLLFFINFLSFHCYVLSCPSILYSLQVYSLPYSLPYRLSQSLYIFSLNLTPISESHHLSLCAPSASLQAFHHSATTITNFNPETHYLCYPLKIWWIKHCCYYLLLRLPHVFTANNAVEI